MVGRRGAVRRGILVVVRIERHDGYWLVVGPAAPGAAATTIWSVIFMRARAVGNARLLRHEREHVRQWHEQGVVGFAVRYLGAYLHWRLRRYPHWAAYRRIPQEVEAEWLARRSAPARALATPAGVAAGAGAVGEGAGDEGSVGGSPVGGARAGEDRDGGGRAAGSSAAEGSTAGRRRRRPLRRGRRGSAPTTPARARTNRRG